MSHSIVIADDHPIVLGGLKSLLGQDGGFDILAACRDGEEALFAIRRSQPVAAVLDIRMPGLDGLSIVDAIVAEGLPTRAILLTAALDSEGAVDAITRGAHGLLVKDAAPEMLIECLQAVLAGERWAPSDLLGPALERLAARQAVRDRLEETLSSREMQIATLVAKGCSNKIIAERLNLATGTVKVHLHNIFEKLGVGSRGELSAAVQRLGGYEDLVV